MVTVATLLVRMRADTTNLIAGVGKAKVSLSGLLSIATKVAAGIAAISAGISFLAVKLAIDFESAMTGVRKTVDATESQFAALEKGILDMSKRIPIAATEIAGVAEAAGQLGIAVEDILLFTEEMLKLGVATDLSARDGAIALARFSNVMNTPIEKVGNLVASLVGLGNSVAATESEILTFAVRLAKTGAIVGLSEADVLGLAGGLTELGIRAELGSTAFSRVFADMASAAAAGGKQLDKFAAVAGLSAIEFGNIFKDNAVEAMVLFVEGLGNLQDAGENVFAFLDELGLGAVRVRDSLLGAALGSDGLREAIALANREFEAGTAATEEFNKRLDTAASKFSTFKNKLVTVGIKIGDALLPDILEDLNALSDWLDANEDRITDAFVGFIDNIRAAFAVLVPVLAEIKIAVSALAETIGKIPFDKFPTRGPAAEAAARREGVKNRALAVGGAALVGGAVAGPPGAFVGAGIVAAGIVLNELTGAGGPGAFAGLTDKEFDRKISPTDSLVDLIRSQSQLEAFVEKKNFQVIRESAKLTRNATDAQQAFYDAIVMGAEAAAGDLRAITRRINALLLSEARAVKVIDVSLEQSLLDEFQRNQLFGGPTPTTDALREQQERLDAAFGSTADGVNRLLDALMDFQQFRMEQRVEAFFKSGAEGVTKLETEFSRLDAAWEAILPGLRALTNDVPEQWRILFERINTETEAGLGRLGGIGGGLLAVLVARRLMAAERFGDEDPRAGLRTREVTTGGGTGTVIQIETLSIGEGAQTTTAEIAVGIADGAREALGAASVRTN